MPGDISYDLFILFVWVAFPGGSVSKEPACNAGDPGDICLIPGLGRFPGEGQGNLLQYSYLENSMNRGACRATVYRVSKSWTQLKQLSTGQSRDCVI